MSSVLREFQKTPPPRKIGYRRQWISYDPVLNIPPRWEYVQVPQNQREIMMVILDEIDKGNAESQEVKTPQLFSWDIFFESWVPMSTQDSLYERDVYLNYLRRIHGPFPSLTVQVKKQLDDYKAYLSGHKFAEHDSL